MALPAAIRCTLALSLDGDPLAGFPAERRPTGPSVEHFEYVRAADSTTVLDSQPAPLLTLPASVLLVTTDSPVRVALNDQDQDGTTDLGLTAGGVIFLSQVTVTAVRTANPTEQPAVVTMLALAL